MTQTACLALAVSLLYLVSRLALLSTLFPYTTLFRSLAQLQAQALLAARIEFPGDRHTVRLPGAQRVARRRLDLDHLGAEIGEHLREGVACDQPREIQDAHALERAAHPWGVVALLDLRLHRVIHSALAPDSFTTRPHLACSALRNEANCSGEPPRASPPSAASLSRTSGVLSARFTSAFSLAMTGAGVPAGASNPYQVLASKPL